METLNPNHSTTISFNAENIYPSIKYTLVEKTVDYFAATLSIDESTKIKKYLELIKFATSSNILTFRGKYYKYNRAVKIHKRGLTIEGFESA